MMEKIGADDPLVTQTGIMSLVNCLKEPKEGGKSWTIFVATTFNKDRLQGYVEQISNYFNTPVDIILEPSYFQAEEVTPTERIAIQEGRLLGSRTFNDGYIRTPFFTGPSNQEQCDTLAYFQAPKCSAILLLVYSHSGFGKSHMLQKLAFSLWKEKRLRVYFNSSLDFLEDLKGTFSKPPEQKYDFLSIADYIIIDDLQFLASERLAFAMPGLFTTLEMAKEKKLIVSMDKLPDTLFEDRIVSRLKEGLVFRLDPPDDSIKFQYINYYIERHEIKIADDIRRHIMLSSPTLRAMRGYLQICDHIYQTTGDITFSGYALRTEHLGNPVSLIRERNDLVFGRILTLLREHFGYLRERTTKTVRKSRKQAVIDNIMVYYFDGIISRIELSERNGIPRGHYQIVCDRGQRAAENLPDDVKKLIQGEMKLCQK